MAAAVVEVTAVADMAASSSKGGTLAARCVVSPQPAEEITNKHSIIIASYNRVVECVSAVVAAALLPLRQQQPMLLCALQRSSWMQQRVSGHGNFNISRRIPVFSSILNVWCVRNILSVILLCASSRCVPVLVRNSRASCPVHPRNRSSSPIIKEARDITVPSAHPADATAAVIIPPGAGDCQNYTHKPEQPQRQAFFRRLLLLHPLVAALLTRSCYYHGSMTLYSRAASAVALCSTVVAAAAPTAAVAATAAAATAPGSAGGDSFSYDNKGHAALLLTAPFPVHFPPFASKEEPHTTRFLSSFPTSPLLPHTLSASSPSASSCHISSNPRVAHQTLEHHSCFADSHPLSSPPSSSSPVFHFTFPTSGTQGILAAASTKPSARSLPADSAAAGSLLRSGRRPAAEITTSESISPRLLPSSSAKTSGASRPSVAVSARQSSILTAASLNKTKSKKAANNTHSVSATSDTRQQQNKSLFFTVVNPLHNRPSIKAAATSTKTTPPQTSFISPAIPFLHNFLSIPPITSFFFDKHTTYRRVSETVNLLLRDHRLEAAAARPATARTLTAATAGATAPISYSASSPLPPFSAAATFRSWLSSALSPFWLSIPSVHTPREELSRVCSFSSSAVSAKCVGSAGVRRGGGAGGAAGPPAVRSTAITASPGLFKNSKSTAAASVIAGSPIYPPLCAGCSSLVPSFIMAAAASAGDTAAMAVEGGDKDKQLTKQPPKPREKYRFAYKPPDFQINTVDLTFDLHEENTKVTSILVLHRRSGTEPTDLVLDGEDLKLLQVQLEGERLANGTAAGSAGGVEPAAEEPDTRRMYMVNDEGKLVIPKYLLPEEADRKFVLMTEVLVNPKANLKLMGLYKSGRFLVTQCEAEGFRRITFFIDRPDVMALYKVKLIADKKTCPTLLSNGNQIEAGEVEGNPDKHYAVFEDPFPKPCYLFALVAGELANISQKFTTFRGREVLVRIFSEPQESDKLEWAMQSLLKAMKWDEERFGLEYDLNIFNVVCAADFNMGAMENKSLNIFNSAALLAHPKTSTDANYEVVLSVIGHEYFHNWTGNRVTCRDWFQLTLKEGLTVFREQLFTADMFSAAVKRIEDVRRLRGTQFVEDSGPMAHPIRPESYVAIDNFYTSTVYSKGAEVIRMYHTLLGERGFRRGMDLYFRRHDGHAVTCDDFRNAMADANNKDLTQFELWYSQAGTPLLEVLEATWLGPKENAFKLTVKQSTPPTPQQPYKKPLHIPIKFGLIGKQSKKDVLIPSTQVLELTAEEQTFVVSGVQEDVVVSFLRDFSAPVKVKYPGQTDQDIAFLMAYDSDGFSKWQAAYTLASKIVCGRAEMKRDGKVTDRFPPLPQIYVDAFRATLLDSVEDKSVQAYTLRLPDLDGVAQDMDPIDPDALYAATEAVREELDTLLHDDLLQVYEALSPPATETEETRDQGAVARRRLRNVLLYFLTAKKDEAAAKFAMKHFMEAKGMTDRFAALTVLVDMEHPEKQEALDVFYKNAEGNPLVLNKWFALQAMSECPDTIDVVRRLQSHPDFTWTNPNRLRALVFTFSRGTQFHNINGEGYKLVADSVLKVDQFNPQVAAHGAGAFLQWRRYGTKRQELMLEQLRRIRDTPGLSPDTREIVDKALANDPSLRRSERAAKPAEPGEKGQTHSKQE